MKRLFPLFALFLLLASCSEEAFDVSSLSLRGNIGITISDTVEREESLVLSAAFSDLDESYTFRAVSPDGILVWEGTMSGSDILRADIEITPGASFPAGEYSILFYSTNAYVREYDGEGILLREGEREKGYMLPDDTESATLSTVDRFGNSISVSQSFLQEA